MARARRSAGAGSVPAPLVAILELVASEHPEVLDFQLETLLNSVMRSAVLQLAADLGVPLAKLGQTVYRASLDLDRLEKRRGVWRDPVRILESPNVAALLHVCAARAGRVQGVVRRRKLEMILRSSSGPTTWLDPGRGSRRSSARRLHRGRKLKVQIVEAG